MGYGPDVRKILDDKCKELGYDVTKPNVKQVLDQVAANEYILILPEGLSHGDLNTFKKALNEGFNSGVQNFKTSEDDCCKPEDLKWYDSGLSRFQYCGKCNKEIK